MFIENYEVIKPYIVKTQYVENMFAVGLTTKGQRWEFISNSDLNISSEYIPSEKIWLFIIPNNSGCEAILLNYIKTSLDYFFEMEKKADFRESLINEIDVLFEHLDFENFKKVKINAPKINKQKQELNIETENQNTDEV